MPDLLIELFSEEIPARMQAKAADDLKKLVTDGLVDAGLIYAGAQAFSTPRRLTLALDGLTAESPTVREERKGPRTDAPEKAIEGFLRGAGVNRDDLEVRDDKKGQVYFATIVKPGRAASEIVAEVLEKTIRNFPWPKSMRWGAGSLRWVRPLHSIICILSDETGATTVPVNIDGIEASDITKGHRFMGPEAFRVVSFDDYEAKLKRSKVILNADERAEAIWHDATNMAFAAGLEVVDDKGLLKEVAGLVEWPVVLMGTIDEEFLELPPEVLQTSMKEHQKFFSVRSSATGRIERFITVANRETADNGATILAGNQKVLSARLADAKFFWENDLRIAKDQKMQPWLDSLSNVTFHNKLGSQRDRISRISGLSRKLAGVTGVEVDLAVKASEIAKADLSSEMIYEFAELQGLMGRYYAEAAGFPTEAAAACEEHYQPLGPSDDVPEHAVSATVALADKLDTLTGFWAIDEKPTGSKDPFALRRAALGVIRIILAKDLRLSLDHFIDSQLLVHKIAEQKSSGAVNDVKALESTLDEIADHGVFGAAFRLVLDRLDGDDAPDMSEGSALRTVGDQLPDASTDLLAFFHDRLKVYLRDQGIRYDVIDACLAMPGYDDLALLVRRATALSETLKTDDGENLIQAFRRANNILTQAEEKDGVEYSYGADVKFAESDEERALFSALDAAEANITPAMESEDFVNAMTTMAELRGPIDAFFEAVQINTDNTVVRRNRLNLLSRIRQICLSVADLTKIEG